MLMTNATVVNRQRDKKGLSGEFNSIAFSWPARPETRRKINLITIILSLCAVFVQITSCFVNQPVAAATCNAEEKTKFGPP